MKNYKMSRLIVVTIAAIAVVFLSVKCGGPEPEHNTVTPPALFGFKENLGVKWDESTLIKVNINSQDIAKLEVVIDDEVYQSWDAPKANFEFELLTSEIGLGSHKLNLLTTSKNGETFVDNRLMRVLSNLTPEVWSVEIVNSYNHQVSSFTQGLEFDGNQLYEGTGQRGESLVAKVDLNTGEIQTKQMLDATKFGEGITMFGDVLYQLTWTAGKCYTYDKNTLTPLQKEYTYQGEGWGLTHNDTSLIMSNGKEYLTFRDPESFEIQKTIQVYTHMGPVPNINELEYVDGFIYANIWMTNMVAVIDPATGRVIAEIDGTSLVREGKGQYGAEFNGIAYNHATKKMYMTGKRWMKLFEVKINKPAA